MKQEKCKVVMLPTEKASHIFLEADKKTIRYNPTKLLATDSLNGRYQNQHLYILSDEEIKDSDWCYNWFLECLVQADYLLTGNPPTLNKIIASTDESLGPPRPSDSFIKKYCELGEIKKVLVEFEEITKEELINPMDRETIYTGKFRLKVAPDNTITIHRAEKKTPMWVGIQIPTVHGIVKVCLGIDQVDGNEIPFYNDQTESWEYIGDISVLKGNTGHVFDKNNNLITI